MVSLQFTLSPMMLFAIGIENPFDVTVQCPHDANPRKHRRSAVAFGDQIKVSTAVCHPSICCSAFGSFWIYLAASSRVTIWRPRGSGIGSSNLRFQPRSLMTPTLLVEFGPKTLWWPRRRIIVARVAPWTRRAGGTACARKLAFPRSFRVRFANPTRVLAE
jgi:hypothetical protein